jgi:tetratricopeptide (TPR) repeat protein
MQILQNVGTPTMVLSLLTQKRLNNIATGSAAPKNNSLSAEFWSQQGVSNYSNANYNEAIKCFDKSIESDPHNAATFEYKGSALLKLRRFNDALQAFKESIAINAQSAHALLGKAQAEDQLKRRDEAIGDYRRFLALASRNDASLITFVHNRLVQLGSHP